MKKFLLIMLMAVALSATAQQTPTNKTRSNNDYSQVDNYLIGLKRLGIPTSETDNLDASGLPQNTVKIIYNTTLGRLRIYNPLSTSWSDASVSDLTPYYKKTQVDSLFTVLGENVIHKTGNEIKVGNLGLDGLLQTNFYTPGQDNPGVTVRNFTGDGSAGVSLISGENQLYMYQIGNAGDLYGAHYNDIAKFISYTNSGLGTMRFGVNGEQLILSQNHVKVTMPATENDDVVSLGQMNSITDGNFIRKSGNNAVGDFQLDKDLKTYLQLGTNETVLSAGRYPYTKAQSFINLNPMDADYNNTNTVLGSAVQNPDGSTYTYKSIDWKASENEMRVQNGYGYGLRYNQDSDWSNATDGQTLMPKKYVDNNYLPLGGGTLNGALLFDNSFSDWGAIKLFKKGHIDLYDTDNNSHSSIYQQEDGALWFGNSGGQSRLANDGRFYFGSDAYALTTDLNGYMPFTGGTFTGDLVVSNDKFYKGTKTDGTIGYTMGISSNDEIYFGDIINNIKTKVHVVGSGQSITIDSTGMLINSDKIKLSGIPYFNYDSPHNLLAIEDGVVKKLNSVPFVKLNGSTQTGSIGITGQLALGGNIRMKNDQFVTSKDTSGRDATLIGLTNNDHLYVGDFIGSITGDTRFYGSGSLRMFFPNSGGININTTMKANDDIEITDPTKGYIIKSPNGTRWRITINDAGDFVKTAL